MPLTCRCFCGAGLGQACSLAPCLPVMSMPCSPHSRSARSSPAASACMHVCIATSIVMTHDHAVSSILLLQAALSGADLVLHAAGPFQRKGSRLVLETAIALGIPYVDVCDDAEYAQSCKELHQQAVSAGVPAIISSGIYPGVLRHHSRGCESSAILHCMLSAKCKAHGCTGTQS